jgi:phospholipase C
VTDAAAGTLLAVSFLDPRFLDEDSGTSANDHPHADIRAGQYFLAQVYKTVTTSPLWPRIALVINYDERGGFFDHVPPGTAPDRGPIWAPGCADSALHACTSRPRSRRHHVGHGTYDHETPSSHETASARSPAVTLSR